LSAIFLLQAVGGSPFGGFLIPVAFLAIFYFVLILPQRREQKRHREMIAALARGDRVATAGGLIGEIIQLRDDEVTLKTGEARVVVERGRIVRRLGAPGTAERT
jgi:preprotein translocase subunit YajC